MEKRGGGGLFSFQRLGLSALDHCVRDLPALGTCASFQSNEIGTISMVNCQLTVQAQRHYVLHVVGGLGEKFSLLFQSKLKRMALTGV
jgi:hypothetical protein